METSHYCIGPYAIPIFALMAHNWQKMKKEYSWPVPAMKFIGMKQLV